MNLNTRQLEARNHINGPLLIIAGAGSGKTATLISRVEYMILEKGIPPESIFMVTFTNKAASEMKQRLAKVLGREVPRNLFSSFNFPLIGTFHSIGVFILKQVLTSPLIEKLPESFTLNKNFIIYDEQDKLSLIKSILKDRLQIDDKQFPPRQVSSYISHAKNALITPNQYAGQVDSPIKEVVYKVYTEYEKQLISANAIDFDDILIKTLELLKNNEVLDHYQSRLEYFMVDEYQDTNRVQYEITKLLVSKSKNLVVVGDDSQSIYSWRGANMQNILDFKKDYPDATIIKLEQNYRSTKNIISAANKLIKNNNSGIAKELWTELSEGKKIQLIEAPDDRTEARMIVDIISENGAPLRNNLILYRTNAQSRQIEEALLYKNLPYKVVGGMKFYDRKEVKDILAYLKYIHNQNDFVSLKRIINTPSRKIGNKSLETIENYSQFFGFSYTSVIENIEDVDELNAGAKRSIQAFHKLMQKCSHDSESMVVSELIEKIISYTDYKEYITKGLSEEEKDSKILNLDELINVASEYNGMNPEESLSTFLEEVSLISDMDKNDDSADYVTLMTIHTAKGLEEKRVFLCGLEEGLFPSFRSISSIEMLEEERRLMYVAVTRAKEELYISKAAQRFSFGDFVRNPKSRFIDEIPSEHIETYNSGISGSGFFSSMSQSQEQESFSYSPPKPRVNRSNNVSDFYKGAKVTHHKFGDGIIIDMQGELASISFPAKGTKKMNIKIAPITLRK